MAQKESPRDDKLIQDLYEKLNWFTFEASEEEFDEEQVQAILELLDKLDPLPAPGAGVAAKEAGAGEAGTAAKEETAWGAGAAAKDEPLSKAGAVEKDGTLSRAGAVEKDEPLSKAGAAAKEGALSKAGTPAENGGAAARQKKGAAFASGRNASSAKSGAEQPDGGRLDDPAAAFERFKKRYHITDEDLARKDGRTADAGMAADGRSVTDSPKAAKNGDSAVERSVASFPAEIAGELAFDGPQVRKKLETGKVKGGRREKRRRHVLGSTLGKVAAAVIIIAAAGTYLSIGTSAVPQKSFFEVVQDGVNSLKFTVTGNVMESEEETEYELEKIGEDAVYYGSWDEVAKENGDILTPSYIPNGLELEEICMRNYSNYTSYIGLYSKKSIESLFVIKIFSFKGNYSEAMVINEDNWEKISVDKQRQIRYYQQENYYMALWKSGKNLYLLEWNNLDEINEIIDKMS